MESLEMFYMRMISWINTADNFDVKYITKDFFKIAAVGSWISKNGGIFRVRWLGNDKSLLLYEIMRRFYEKDCSC